MGYIGKSFGIEWYNGPDFTPAGSFFFGNYPNYKYYDSGSQKYIDIVMPSFQPLMKKDEQPDPFYPWKHFKISGIDDGFDACKISEVL